MIIGKLQIDKAWIRGRPASSQTIVGFTRPRVSRSTGSNQTARRIDRRDLRQGVALIAGMCALATQP
jgi:hypothetical protein